MTQPPRRKRPGRRSRSRRSRGGQTAEAAPGKDPGARRWRPNPIQLLLTLGAIAGAILSIAGVIALVTPNESPGPRGNFESVTADPGQGLTEFAARQQTADSAAGGVARGRVQLASLGPAQVSQSSTSTEPTNTETAPETTTETTPTEPTPPPPPVTESRQLLNELQQRLSPETLPHGWDFVTVKGEPQLRIRKQDYPRSLSFVERAPPGEGGEDAVAAKDLLRVFRATRTRPVAAGGKTEPVGAAVNYNLTLDNLKDRTVEVRWSMYRVGAGSPLPHDWLVNRRVYREHVDRSSKRLSRQFWVPLPRRRGPYFVRLSAWEGDNRLDYADSKPPFR